MACKACELLRVPASTPERTAATMDFILDSCILPASVTAGVPFDIKIVYKLCTIEIRNPGGDLQYFPDYDGIYWRYTNLIHSQLESWVWRLNNLGLLLLENPPEILSQGQMYAKEIRVDNHGIDGAAGGSILTYNFHGTIEQLLGRQFSQPATVNLAWSIFGQIYGWYAKDNWPWNWNPTQNYLDFSRVAWILHSIQVNVPPLTPDPIFNLDLCSVSKTAVAPTEQFSIKLSLQNQNETAGSYEIVCYCSGNQLTLATGTISGYGTKSHTFNVTANQLAQTAITSSQYLSFSIAVLSNENETDRWTPPAIAVIVEAPPETANLSGRITDKQTGAGIAGISITADGYSTTSDSTGLYSLNGLAPGPYTIEFSGADYWPETKSKTLVTGNNILNIAMTPSTEAQPGNVPWQVVAAGAASVAGVILVIEGVRKGRKK
jgi:hypothetical protein